MNAGMILQTGSPQELHHYPQDPFVGYFIGSPGMNVFPVVVQDSELKVGGYSLPVSIEAWRNLSGRAHKLGIRPEFIETSLTQRSGWLNCTVRTVTMTSNAQIVDLHGAGLNFKARLDENTNINEGGEVWVNFPKDRLMLYANDKAIRLDEEEIV
jgi:glycerol transport system ATP-binding protein